MSQGKKGAGSLVLALSLLFAVGCAKERPVKPVIANTSRVAKAAFTGTYLYLRAITDVQSPGRQNEWMAPGMYMEADKLVQFNLKENALEVVELDPQFQQAREARTNSVLASFSARHVDVLRKQNVDGDNTHEEEETESRNVWQQRAQVILDTTKDSVDSFNNETLVANAASGVEIDNASGAINFTVTRRLKDDTLVTIKHSFVKFENNPNYTAKVYPRELQRRFGFFKTTTLDLDKYGRITTATRKEIANRWDTSKKVVYYLSKNFPAHLVPKAKEIFANWNDTFKAALGKDVVEVRENSGQELGDLRYSMITYDASETSLHRILGYGPSYTNPRTGEVIKADVILYGGSLKRSVYTERMWETLLAKKQGGEGIDIEDLLKQILPGGHPPTPGAPKRGESGLSELMSSFVAKQEGRLPAGDLPVIPMLRPTSPVNQEMVALTKEFALEKTVREMKTAFLKDHMKRITSVNEDVMRLVNETKHAAARELTDEELEVQIFTPLLTHELGHTFGLRHNFEGSADKRHYEKPSAKAPAADAPELKSKSSSVMDYGFLTSQEPQGVGSYDAAAIQVLYGSDEAKTKALIDDNYFFCTDENILDSRNGLCNQFDSGDSLTAMVTSQLDRYYASFVFNNVKGDRVSFGSARDYMSRVSRYLVPIRLAFDNAQAILTAARGTNAANFWYVAGQRVEADAGTKAADILKIQVPESYGVTIQTGQWGIQPSLVERRLDKSKIAALMKDAEDAQDAVFEALIGIVMDSERPMYSSGDLVHDELQIRGTLQDKILAMMYLYTRMPDPSGNGGVITPFKDLQGGAASLFLSHLLANTAPTFDATTKQGGSRLSPYDVNLRQVALNLLWHELAVPGTTAGSRDMLASEKITIDVTTLNRKTTIRQTLAALPALKKMLEAQKEKVSLNILQTSLLGVGLNLSPMPTLSLLPALLQIPDVMALNEANAVLAKVAEAEVTGKAELAGLDAASSRDLKTVEQIDVYRSQIRARMKALMGGGLDKTAQGKAVAEIAALESQRNQINTAYLNTLGDTFLKAPVNLPLQSYGATTGRLIRDNMNRMEDQRQAALDLITQFTSVARAELAKPAAAQNQALLQQLQTALTNLTNRVDGIGDYLSSEKMVVESMYHLYNGGNP